MLPVGNSIRPSNLNPKPQFRDHCVGHMLHVSAKPLISASAFVASSVVVSELVLDMLTEYRSDPVT